MNCHLSGGLKPKGFQEKADADVEEERWKSEQHIGLNV